MPQYSTAISKPANFSKDDVSTFIEMVRERNPANSLTIPPLTRIAELLVISKSNGKFVAIAAIKNPNDGYRAKIFLKYAKVAKSKEELDTFRELGYVQSSKEFAGQKQAKRIVTAILEEYGASPLYASTEKPKMATILEKNGFIQVG